MVFVGMQPVLTQVPPKSFRSTIATFIPAPASRPARDGPACPVPMMIASNRVFMGVAGGPGHLFYKPAKEHDVWSITARAQSKRSYLIQPRKRPRVVGIRYSPLRQSLPYSISRIGTSCALPATPFTMPPMIGPAKREYGYEFRR